MSFHGKIPVPLDIASIQLIEWNHGLFSYDICPTEFCSVFVSQWDEHWLESIQSVRYFV